MIEKKRNTLESKVVKNISSMKNHNLVRDFREGWARCSIHGYCRMKRESTNKEKRKKK